MKIELKILEAIHTTVYDVFAYRLGADEWEQSETEFQKLLAENLGKIEVKVK